jgi:uroporphyrinogen-III synthase
MSTILLTRTEELSLPIAQQIKNEGHKAIIQPLFSVSYQENLQPANQQIQGVLITSANAIFALEKLKIAKNIQILAVGDVTASKIKNLGYKNVIAAQNSAQSLLELAQEKLQPNLGLILYLSGEIITLNLAERLQKMGSHCQRIVTYRTIERKELSKETIAAIENGDINEIWLYSQNSGKIFAKLAKKHRLERFLEKITTLQKI